MLTVSISDGTVTIKEVYNGDDKLIKSTDYTIDAVNKKVTIKKEYLETLQEGSYKIKIETNQGDVFTNIKVTETE